MKKENYRKFETSSGKKLIAGKNAEQNEELVKKYMGKENIVLHTKKPGSPFVIILGKASIKDIKEAAVFTALYSQAWKKRKKDVIVDYFLAENVFKEKRMKTGTFGVLKNKNIKVKKEKIIKFEKEICQDK